MACQNEDETKREKDQGKRSLTIVEIEILRKKMPDQFPFTEEWKLRVRIEVTYMMMMETGLYH